MFDFHKDKERYFNYQYLTSKEYIIPFVSQYMDLSKPLKVLEIGCAEAGVLKAFIELGHNCTGIELSQSRVDHAKHFLMEAYEKKQIDFITRDIYKIDVEKDLPYKYDLVILKDVIEHIPEQERFINELKKFLNPRGKVFFGFPPWYMPFGGHQQLAKSKLLSFAPYYHILPKPIYKGILRMFGETPEQVNVLMEIKDTAISVERFERILKKNSFKILKRQLFLINPIYKYKFKLKVRKQAGFIAAIPYVRDLFSTCAYYLIECE